MICDKCTPDPTRPLNGCGKFLNKEQAFLAAILYLRRIYGETNSETRREGIRDMLCEMMFADGMPIDTAVWPNWLEALERVMNGSLIDQEELFRSIAALVQNAGIGQTESPTILRNNVCQLHTNDRILTAKQAVLAYKVHLPIS